MDFSKSSSENGLSLPIIESSREFKFHPAGSVKSRTRHITRAKPPRHGQRVQASCRNAGLHSHPVNALLIRSRSQNAPLKLLLMFEDDLDRIQRFRALVVRNHPDAVLKIARTAPDFRNEYWSLTETPELRELRSTEELAKPNGQEMIVIVAGQHWGLNLFPEDYLDRGCAGSHHTVAADSKSTSNEIVTYFVQGHHSECLASQTTGKDDAIQAIRQFLPSLQRPDCVQWNMD